MFPSTTARRIADTLLDIADAMLRPLPVDHADELGAHPHRHPARIARERRTGAGAPRTHHCISPVPGRSAATRRTPSRA